LYYGNEFVSNISIILLSLKIGLQFGFCSLNKIDEAEHEDRKTFLHYSGFVIYDINTSAARVAASGPPAINAGWNLLSIPCDITVTDMKAKAGGAAFDVFTWTGESYSATDTMRRGYGYAINSGAKIDILDFAANQ